MQPRCPVWALSILVLGTLLLAPAAVPVFKARGTHYEVGHQIGERFAREIRECYSLYSNLRQVFVPWLRTPTGHRVFGEYLAVAKKTYPQYLREIAGLAAGAGLPLEEVQLMNFHLELEALLLGKFSEPDACTDIFVNNPQAGCVAIGHNEDNPPYIAPLAYISDVHIVDGGPECHMNGTHCVEERFVAYTYPGQLPGTAFGFNYNRVIFSGNALYPKTVLTGARTGRQILNRAIQGARSLEDIQKIYINEGYGSDFGFSSNNAMLHNGTKPVEMANFELAPDGKHRRSAVSRQEVLPPSGDLVSETSSSGDLVNGTSSSGFYYHVNLYRRLKVPETDSQSSVHRAKRINQLPTPKAISDIKYILGDTKDKEFPVFRRPTATDPGMTLCTAIFNLKECRLDIYDDNPNRGGLAPVNSFLLPGCGV